MSGPLYDYTRWPNFSKEELACHHTHLENPNVEEFTRLINFVQYLRNYFGVPFKVTSAYRHETHPIEAKKIRAGQHTIAAIDIQVPTEIAHELVKMAFAAGCTGVGFNLHGSRHTRFIHLDFRTTQPFVWSYP